VQHENSAGYKFLKKKKAIGSNVLFLRFTNLVYLFMKWYPNIAASIVKALEDIFNHQKQGDKVINTLLKSQPKWGSRDRRFVAGVLYDIIRWKRLYEYLADADIKTEKGKWAVLGVWSVFNQIDLPDWKEFKPLKPDKIREKFELLNDEKIKQSVPDWLFDLGQAQLKSEWLTELKALNQEAEVVLRANTLKTTPEKLQKILEKEGLETYRHQEYPDALFLKNRRKLTHLKSYKQGLFEVQDASSQLVAPFTGAKPGQTVIDACAGAGGKTLHLAAQMQNKGQILAYDIYESKIKELKLRAKRSGVKNIVEAGVINNKILKKNHQRADILLLDTPCSSLGTLRRKPGLKWELNSDKLRQINVIQRDILKDYEAMLKPGGTLIYVTCSILPLENQEVVKNFLKTNKNYKFVEDKTILPSKTKGDGFYMAKLKKQL